MGWKRPRHGPSQVLGLVVYKHRPTWNPLHRGRSSLETYQLQALGHKATCQILRYKRAVGVGVTTRSPGEDCPHSQIHQWDLSHGCYRFPSWISGTLLFLFHQLEDTFTSLTSRMLSVVDTARLGKKNTKWWTVCVEYLATCLSRVSLPVLRVLYVTSPPPSKITNLLVRFPYWFYCQHCLAWTSRSLSSIHHVLSQLTTTCWVSFWLTKPGRWSWHPALLPILLSRSLSRVRVCCPPVTELLKLADRVVL